MMRESKNTKSSASKSSLGPPTLPRLTLNDSALLKSPGARIEVPYARTSPLWRMTTKVEALIAALRLSCSLAEAGGAM